MTDHMQCVKCCGRSTLYLCNLCQTELRKQLLRMPRLVGYLQEAALGMTRMSNENSRQSGFRSRTPVLDDRAAELAAEIERVLGQWARPLAATGGYVIPVAIDWARPIGEYAHTSADYAVFLAIHVDDLAKNEFIGELCGSLRGFIKRAVGGRQEGGLLNRRMPAQFCGPCPTWITDHWRCKHPPEGSCIYRAHECATTLMAPRGALEVTCGVCGAVHRTERLRNSLLARADYYKGTVPEIYEMLWKLGEHVKLNTLYHWANPKKGSLRPAGYLRADGRRIAPTRHSDKDTPVYLVGDVRKMRAERLEPGHRGPPLNKDHKKGQVKQ